MKSKTDAFEDLKDNIQLVIGSHTSGSGFHEVFCPMCGNTGQKKGGFKFESDKIVYNCFRGSCDATTVYDVNERVPKKFRNLMDAFGVQVPVELLVNQNKTVVKLFRDPLDEDRFIKNTYKPMKMPSDLKPLEESRHTEWMYSVIGDRLLLDYDYHYAKEGKFRGCLALPMYHRDKLIGIEYYSRNGQYITQTENEHLIFLREKWPDSNVIVVEGIMDALCFPNTCAVKHSKITPEQAYHLRKHDPIILPDRKNSQLYECAKEFGFRVCLPGWEYKDLNEAVQAKGIFVAAQMIHDNTFTVGLKTDTLHRAWAINDRRTYRK